MEIDLLDYSKNNNKESAIHRILLSIVWLLFSIILVFESLTLFNMHFEFDNNPQRFALIDYYLPTKYFGYRILIQSFLGILISIAIILNKKDRKEILVAYFVSILLFGLCEVLFVFFPESFLNYEIYGSLILTFLSLSYYKTKLLPLNLSELKFIHKLIIISGVLPFIFVKTLDYKKILVWDISWIEKWLSFT
ncbi:hypothetical protein [Aureispira sp. CCB-E]|uniref:hypothetical protein n=1 Tax=Aureispira sp. CCB-E TaxID=3051121 RepID=UPI0028686808|nr:hypothetical protein [Aureispira sp. CCB-E]WMX13127.1 hypothetical protein QP953_19995 [Aureispira sp. CCB-E]